MRRRELESRLVALDEEIAQKEREIKDIESGKLDEDIPRLYAELIKQEAEKATAKLPPASDHQQPSAQQSQQAAPQTKVKTEREELWKETDNKEEEEGVGSTKYSTKTQQQQQQQHRGRPRINRTPAAATTGDTEGLTQAEIDQRITALNSMRKNMDEIVRLALRKDSVFFDHAVTKEEAPDYSDTIRHRIDLSFLQRRIQRGRYQWPACRSTVEAGALFSRDMMLMFANAFVFNAPGSEICGVAESLKASCIKHLKEFNMWPDQQTARAQVKSEHGRRLQAKTSDAAGEGEADEERDRGGASGGATIPPTKRRKKVHNK